MKIRDVHGSNRVKFVPNPELTQPNRVCNFADLLPTGEGLGSDWMGSLRFINFQVGLVNLSEWVNLAGALDKTNENQ